MYENRLYRQTSMQNNNFFILTIGFIAVIFLVIIVTFHILHSKGTSVNDPSKILCKLSDSGHLECDCKAGFAGDYCERDTADYSDCTNPQLCNYNGKPYKKGKRCICDCYPDYLGAWCESKRNDIYKVDCDGIEVCCKNGKICGKKDINYNYDCHKHCSDALNSEDPDVKLPKGNCMCGE